MQQELLIRRAAFLSRLIISLILLGGAAGKWTPEYWSGEVLFDIYFVDRDFWFFNYLRDNYEPKESAGTDCASGTVGKPWSLKRSAE